MSVALAYSIIYGGTVYGAASTTESAIKQIPIIDIPQSAESIDKVKKLEAAGEEFFNQGLMEKALVKWQEAYGLSIEMKFADGEGRALTDMARIYLDQGDWVKAKHLGENALEVLGNTNDPRSLGRARVALAQAYFGLGNNESAGEQLSAAISTLTSREGADSAEAGRLLNLAGNLLMRYGKAKEALEFFQQAATYFAQGGDVNNSVRNHLGVAESLEHLGYFTAALEESQKAYTATKNSQFENSSTMVSVLASLANGQYMLGEFSKARSTYEQALALAAKLNNKDFNAVSRANVDLGYAYCLAATGDIDSARQTFERSIEIFKASGASTSLSQAYNGLGNVLVHQGQPGKAVSYFSQALELQAVVRPPQPKMQLMVSQNLAFALSRSGSNREARGQLEAALAVLKKNKDPLLEARTYSALAEVYFQLADAVQSETFVKKAIELGTEVKDDASLWRDYVIQAKLALAGGDTALAKDSLNSALSFFRSPQAGMFVSPEWLNFPTSREDLGEQLVAMLARMGMGGDALLAAEQLKEETFSNEWMNRGGQVKTEDRDVFLDLTTQRAHLHASEASALPSALLKDWQSWLTRFRTLVAQNRSLARMISPVPNHMSDIVRAIQSSRSMFIEYLVGADSSVVFTIDGTGRLSSTVISVNRKQLQSQITSLLNLPEVQSAARETQRERSILQTLYNELFPQAVRNLIPKDPDQTVCIIPDGILFNLPFAALVDSDGKFLVQSHTLTLACSMGAFLDIPPRYASDNSVIVASLHGGQNALMDESSLISGVFNDDNVTTLLGNKADMSALREQARGKAIVHVANPFSLLANNPFNSVLPLAPDKDAGEQKVTAENLFGSSLPNDLAVWSASSVNVKDTQGNSVRVFGRGLNYAGVRNILLSLWVAPDPERTDELMDFYKHKRAGLNQAQSLRKAELVALTKDPSPHAWAAFQLLGPGY